MTKNAIMSVFIALSLTACGGVGFSGRTKSNGNAYKGNGAADGNSEDAVTGHQTVQSGSGQNGSSLTSLDWNLPCEGSDSSDGVSVDSTIDGGGTFTTAASDSYQINFSGSHCDGVKPKKDILFLFDGSNSMSRNDPLTNGTCGRLETMRSIISSLGGTSGNRFGLINFSSGNQSKIVSSYDFYGAEQDLTTALVGNSGKDISEVICDSNHVGTNYDTGFAAAESLIKLRTAADAGSIIFFVSDGQPLFGQTGEAAASRLKAGGTVIATVMVAGDESILKNKLATIDASGAPLHRKVDKIDQLTTAITQLAGSTLVPDVIRYRPVNSDIWTAINLYVTPGSTDWSIPSVAIDPTLYPDGVEVEYLYFKPDTVGKGVLKGVLTFDP